jgi:hypothetical protein
MLGMIERNVSKCVGWSADKLNDAASEVRATRYKCELPAARQDEFREKKFSERKNKINWPELGYLGRCLEY